MARTDPCLEWITCGEGGPILVAAAGLGAAATVRAIEDVILGASAELLEDEATVVVLAISDGF